MSTKLNLNKRTIEGLPIPADGRETYSDEKERYLRLVVSPEGRKVWRYVRKVEGKTRFITIGAYPSTTPDMARTEATRLSQAYDSGEDPAQDKKDKRKIASWSDLFSWYIENHAKPHKRSWKYDDNMNKLYLSPWQHKAITDITTDFITRWHVKTGKDKGNTQADRCLAMIKTVFSKAIDAAQFKGTNPALAVKKFDSNPEGRDRYLKADELKRLLVALTEYHDQDAADFFMVCLFTGARRGNVQSMRWDAMDRSNPELPVWVIPGAGSKNKKKMTIPIVEPVVSILNRRHEENPNDYVFPAKRSNSKTPHLTEPKKAWAAICKTADLQNVRIHDLRRTMGSWQAGMGVSLQIIGKSLGHRSTKSTEVYARLGDEPVRNALSGAAAAMLAVSTKGGEK